MIKVENLTKRYGKTLAVNNLSFEVSPGKVTGFLGPNGSGKSTTMRLIVGLDKPNEGQVTINNSSIKKFKNPMNEIGVLLDADYMHPTRTAKNHLLSIAASNGIGYKRVNEVLELVGLSEVARKRVGKFSLGMKQRIGLAGALLGDPSVVMLDEPANGLDPEGIRWIRDFLSHLASQGRTIFVSSHLLSEMALMADELIVIGQGTLIDHTTVDEITKKASGGYIKVKSPQLDNFATLLETANAQIVKNADSLQVNGIEIEHVGHIALENQIELHELTNVSASLEDAFLELTAQSQEYKTKSIDSLGEDVHND